MKNTSIKRLKIEMIHDIVCSWCPIGYSNLKVAAENLNIVLDFNFLPFQLNPDLPEQGETIENYFSRQFNWGPSKLREYQNALVKTAKNAGISIDFSKRLKYFNTEKAHKLMHFAEQFNKQQALNEKLIQAYFKEGLDISHDDVLINCALQIGLNKETAKFAIYSGQVTQALQEKIKRRNALNIQTIPAFMVNEKTLISGSQSVSFFENMLTEHVNK